MAVAIIKGTGIWVLIMLAAIANGVVRETVLDPVLGTTLALPTSGLLLSLIIFGMSWLSVPLIGRSTVPVWLATGMLWVMLTLAFEYLFGYFIAGMSWREISRVFDLASGNLFLLALFAAALSPWLAARLRGLVN
jgi:hypothetical protein